MNTSRKGLNRRTKNARGWKHTKKRKFPFCVQIGTQLSSRFRRFRSNREKVRILRLKIHDSDSQKGVFQHE